MINRGDPLGVDIYCTSGFPLKMRLTYGQENVQCAALRRLNASEGSLDSIGDDPDYGYDVADQMNSEGSSSDLAAMGARIRSELDKDPRLEQVQVRAMNSGGSTQAIISATTAKGPFTMVAAVGDASVDFLNQGLAGTAPVAAAAVSTTVTVVSQTGPQGIPGVPGASAGGGNAALLPNLDGYYASDSSSETLVDQDPQDFDRLTSGSAALALACYAQVPNGGTGTLRIRVGGTAGVATDGTIVATASITSSVGFSLLEANTTFSKPSGTQPVKLTLQSSVDGSDVLVKQVVVTIT